MERYLAMGNEMIKALGLENKEVILFWKAYEEKRFFFFFLHYRCFKYGLAELSV